MPSPNPPHHPLGLTTTTRLATIPRATPPRLLTTPTCTCQLVHGRYVVPAHATSPYSRADHRSENPPLRANFPVGPQGEVEFNTAKKTSKEKKRKEREIVLQSWVIEQTQENRGTRMLGSSALNTLSLARGHPSLMMPVPLSEADSARVLQGKEVVETAIAMWANAIQIFAVAGKALSLQHTFDAVDGMRCLMHLTWPPPAVAAAPAAPTSPPPTTPDVEARRYWLVGTARNELLLLNEELKPTSISCQGKPSASGQPFGVRLAFGPKPTGPVSWNTVDVNGAPPGITALSTVVEKNDKVVALPEHAALVVGFEDGSVRQYKLEEILRSF